MTSGGDGALTFDVRVSPRSSRECIEGLGEGRVRIRVNASPVNNAANRRVLELVARAFGVPKSNVEILAGATRRDKRLRVHGASRRPDWIEPL